MKKVLAFFIMMILLQAGCKKSENPVDPGITSNGKISTGQPVNLTTESVSTAGGVISISKPGDPLDGLQLTVPSNSFSRTISFNISYAEIKDHELGQYFNPVSPLIKIKYEGGYSEHPIKLKIPIKLPKGHFAMGFFYDESTGKLEGLPINDLDSNFIVISTRHFQSNSAQMNKPLQGMDAEIVGDIIISSIDESVLSSQSKISSGFVPGYDDWEFINFGSYVAPGGHCAGQSVSAMWYYLEKTKKGAQQLYHAFDNICDMNKPITMWQDNPRGYKFASTIQKDMKFTDWANDMNIQFNKPDITFKAFALSMLENHEPQLVCIRKSTPDYGGHAMIVYSIDYPNGILYVADPNYPGNRNIDAAGTHTERKIEFAAGKFKPYRSSLNAATPGTDFNQIGYFAKTAYINWNTISARYYEFENKIIGQDRFPQYKLFINSPSGQELPDNLNYSLSQISVVCKSDECSTIIANTDNLQPFEVYNTKGDLLAQTDAAGITHLKLDPGINKLGFYIKGGDKDGNWQYVDFKWITISNAALSIDPNPFTGQPNTEYTFTAKSYGTAPKNAKYVWSFGDDTPDVTVINDSTVKHTFTKIKDYYVSVQLYDNSNGALVSSASSDVKIATSNYGLVKMAALAAVNFLGEIKFSSSANQPSFTIGLFLGLNSTNSKMTWDKDQFTFTFSLTKDSYIFTNAVVSGYVKGEISSDGNMINWLKAEELVTTVEKKDSVIKRIECKNLPFYQTLFNTVYFRETGSKLAPIITSFELRRKWLSSSDNKWYETYAVSIDYNNGINILETDFSVPY